jgi:hypothetical protein
MDLTRLHLWRGAEGEALAQRMIQPGDRLEALPRAADAEASGHALTSERARELIHLVFESDVVVVW